MVAVLLNKLGRPFACVCGCDVDVAPPSEGKGDADAGFAAPKVPPNRLPPRPPVLAGCDVPEAAPEVPPPRLPNKLVVVPDVVLAGAPNSDLAAGAPDAPPEAGCEAPRLPKSDIVMVVETRLRRVDCAENNHRVDKLWGREAWTASASHPCQVHFNMHLSINMTSQLQNVFYVELEAPYDAHKLGFQAIICSDSFTTSQVLHRHLLFITACSKSQTMGQMTAGSCDCGLVENVMTWVRLPNVEA